MYTEAINHDPALTFFQTGAQQGNRPSMGAWLSYGLGSENKNLPAFTVLLLGEQLPQLAAQPVGGAQGQRLDDVVEELGDQVLMAAQVFEAGL